MHILRRLSKKGQGLVEYALLIAVVAGILVYFMSGAGRGIFTNGVSTVANKAFSKATNF